MADGDAYEHVFPGSLTPVLTQRLFPKPPTTFLTCFCRTLYQTDKYIIISRCLWECMQTIKMCRYFKWYKHRRKKMLETIISFFVEIFPQGRKNNRLRGKGFFRCGITIGQKSKFLFHFQSIHTGSQKQTHTVGLSLILVAISTVSKYLTKGFFISEHNHCCSYVSFHIL